MTLVEKIFSNKLHRKICAGDIIISYVDFIMSHDTTTPLAIESFKKMTKKKVFNPSKIVIIFDHNVPPASINANELQKKVLDFVEQQKIKNFFQEGICHQIMPEKGFVKPGDIIIGADSHTCTYGAFGAFATGLGSTDIAVSWATGKNWFVVPQTIKIELEGKIPNNIYTKDIILYIGKKIGLSNASEKVLEFHGNVIKKMSISSRMTLCNMATEFGAESGLVEADKKTINWLKKRVVGKINTIRADSNSKYSKIIKIDVSKLKPQIACPSSVDNVKEVSAIKNIKVDQVFIGTCANGRLEDLKIAYNILRGKKIKKGLKLIIIPASNEVYLEAIKNGYIQEFIKSGAIICNPGCGPCLGRHEGTLRDGEVCVATMNRNFSGRMGSPRAKIYLTNPEIAVKTALKGQITI